MNPLARYNINHLSPSSLNLWRNAPGIWALRYLAKIRDDGNAAMWRGTAVENGLAAYLRGVDIETACLVAHQGFELNCQGEVSDDIEAERELISPMVRQCQNWTPPGDLNATQLKVEHYLEDVPIPVIGYLDFSFEGIDIDLKTTKACPSTPRPDHVRQVSLYRAARGRQGGLLYVTGKRHAYFPIDDDMMERALGDMQADALSLVHFLTRCTGPQDAIRSLPMDRDHFQFPKTKSQVPLAELLTVG